MENKLKLKSNMKLFPGTIIGLILGILVAVPILYTSAVVAPNTLPTDSGLCTVDIMYTYLERQNTTELITFPTDHNGSTVIEELDEPNVRVIVVLDVTRNFAIATPSFAEIWVYQIEFYTDKGSISNSTCCVGVLTEEPPTFDSLDDIPSSQFHATLNQIMNFTSHANEIYGGEYGGGGIHSCWSIGQSIIESLPVSNNDWVSAVDESEAIFVRVKEVGWIVYNDSAEVVVLPEPNVLADVQLDCYNAGYIHNNAISEEHLAEIDLLDPAPWDYNKAPWIDD
jgi:hypothetical protein